MRLKFVSAVLVLMLILSFSSCGKSTSVIINKNNNQVETTVKATQTEPTTENNNIINPLTGLYDLDEKMKDKRPVSIMINNINKAKVVQTGVGNADMVFETMVEGGITRLLAVYSDISKVGQIGTVRSARYSFSQLACGLDAVYVYCGSDNVYATPLMESLAMDRIDLMNNGEGAAQRLKNGLSYEHTLYTFGNKINNIYKSIRTNVKSRAKDIYNFNDVESPIKYDEAALDVSVNFSTTYEANFNYDNDTKTYVRGNSGPLKDYKTGETENFKNVFVLYSDVYTLDDNIHVKTNLSSGKGVYITQGSCTEITWSKGNSNQPLIFYHNSEQLKLNAGNSYICITDKSNKSKTKIS